MAHRFVLDAKSSLQAFDPHERQIRRYMNERQLDYGVLFNLRELRVYRRAERGHDRARSFNVLALWEVAHDRALPGPELSRLEEFVALFEFRRLNTADKVRQIARAPSWRDLPGREEVQVDVDYLVVRLRELSQSLAEDAALQAAGLDRLLELRPGRVSALVDELQALAREIQPKIRAKQLPTTIEGFRGGNGVPRRAWEQYLTRVAQLALIRVLLFRSWEDAGFVDEHLYDGGFERVYDRLDNDVQRVLGAAFATGRERYRWLYAEDNNYDWFRPRPELVVEVLYSLLPVPLGKLDADVLGGLYESYVDDIDRDRLGQFYTPRSVVRFMLDRVGFSGPDGVFRLERDSREPQRVFDFATGSGGFLVEAARRIVHEALRLDTPDALRDGLRAIVLGFSGSEVSPFPYFLTEVNLLLQVSRLLGRLRELGEPPGDFVLSVVPADTLASRRPRDGVEDSSESTRGTGAYSLLPADVEKRAAFERIRDDEFDLVIGNPPYVAEAGNKVLFDRLRTLPQWRGDYRGKSDYLYYFLLLATEKLKPGGRLCVITPAGWMNAGKADWLREQLADRLRLDELFLFGDFSLFRPELDHRRAESIAPPPTVESAILVAEKIPAPPNHRLRITELRSAADVKAVLGLLPTDRLEARDLLERMDQRAGDVRARVHAGIATRRMPQALLGGELPWAIKYGEQELHMRVVRHLERTATRRAQRLEPLDRRWWIEQGIQTGADAYTNRVQGRLDDDQRAEVAHRGLTIGDPVLELPPGREHEPPWKDNSDLLARAPESRAILYGAIDEADYVSLVWIDGTDTVSSEVEKALEPARPLLASRAAIERDPRRRWYETAWPRDKRRLLEPKVIALYRTDRGRFALDEDGSWQPSIKTTFCTATEAGLSVSYLCGLLNSELLDLYYAVRGKTPRDVWRNYEPKPMARLPYRHIADLASAEAASELCEFERAIARGPETAPGLVRHLSVAPVVLGRELKLLVKALTTNRTELLSHRSAAPSLRAQVKDPWRDLKAPVHAAGVVGELPPDAVRSMRIDPQLRLELSSPSRVVAGPLQGDRLVLRAGRRSVGFVQGPADRLAVLAQLLDGSRVKADELLGTLVPVDLSAFAAVITARQDEVNRLIKEGRGLVEAAERVVCRLYGVPETLADEIVRHASERARRGLPLEDDSADSG